MPVDEQIFKFSTELHATRNVKKYKKWQLLLNNAEGKEELILEINCHPNELKPKKAFLPQV